MSKLYVVSTPIGNMKDITLRALEALKNVDLIVCEDTRSAMKLLTRHGITGKKVISYFAGTKEMKVSSIINEILSGKDVALISEAGTPCISDPGFTLVSTAIEKGIEVVSIPGPSAVAAAASISGFPVDKFVFYGFIPHKKKRQQTIKNILSEDKTVIFYESPHRILKTLKQIVELGGANRKVALCRELTKKFEEVIRGTVSEVLSVLNKQGVRGEFVVVLAR